MVSNRCLPSNLLLQFSAVNSSKIEADLWLILSAPKSEIHCKMCSSMKNSRFLADKVKKYAYLRVKSSG